MPVRRLRRASVALEMKGDENARTTSLQRPGCSKSYLLTCLLTYYLPRCRLKRPLEVPPFPGTGVSATAPLACARARLCSRMGCLCVLVAAIALRPPAPASVAQFTRTAVLRSAAATAAGALAAASQAAPPPEMLLREAAAQAAANEPKVLYTPPSVKGVSTPDELALAQYLKKKGAKFYGAYWCPFCTRQRAMFGAAGVRALPYVECASDGYGAQRCPPQVTGFPTWEIDGQFYSGLKTLAQLQVGAN